MVSEKFYPWQSEQWQQLVSYKQENALPHALLFSGIQGLGKRHIAFSFAHFLLCDQANSPCGKCHACHLFEAKTHPDLLIVEPEKMGQAIKIDQIRETVQFVNETALQGGLRVIIINPANAMNLNAANALLKTLEEPAPNTIIILISDLSFRLPATITSRCQKIIFPKPSQDTALKWLETQLQHKAEERKLLLGLAEGAPLKAKEFAMNDLLTLRQEFYQGLILLIQQKEHPLKLASKLHDQDTFLILNLFLAWLQDLLRLKLTQGQIELINYDYCKAITSLSEKITCESLLGYIDHIKMNYAHLLNSLNLNKQLMLEELFIRWSRYAAS